MAIVVAMIILVLLFTAGLTLWRRFKRWRPAGALLMLLSMAFCGMLIFSLGVSTSTTETVAMVHPDQTERHSGERESVAVTETTTEVDMQGVIMVACLGVLFVMGLLIWGTMCLAWLLRRVRRRAPEVPG